MVGVGAVKDKLDQLRTELKVPGGARTRLTEQPLWLILAWILICVAFWQSGGLIFGPRQAWQSPTYAAIRAFPGGIRPIGVALGVIALVFVCNLMTSNQRGLQIACTAGAIYYLFWAVGVLISWHWHGIFSWGAPVGALAFACCYLALVVKVDERRT